MIAVIFGIPGVGKSTVIQEVLKKLPDIKRIHWGHLSEKIGKEKGVIKDIDDLRKVNIKIQKQMQSDVVEQIKNTISKNPQVHYIIETHSALKTPQGYLPGLNPSIIETIKPDIFIVIEADAEYVWERRQNDKKRKRDDDPTLYDVKMNLETTRYYASVFAVEAAATLCLIENKENDISFAVERVVEFLEKFIK